MLRQIPAYHVCDKPAEVYKLITKALDYTAGTRIKPQTVFPLQLSAPFSKTRQPHVSSEHEVVLYPIASRSLLYLPCIAPSEDRRRDQFSALKCRSVEGCAKMDQD